MLHCIFLSLLLILRKNRFYCWFRVEKMLNRSTFQRKKHHFVVFVVVVREMYAHWLNVEVTMLNIIMKQWFGYRDVGVSHNKICVLLKLSEFIEFWLLYKSFFEEKKWGKETFSVWQDIINSSISFMFMTPFYVFISLYNFVARYPSHQTAPNYFFQMLPSPVQKKLH